MARLTNSPPLSTVIATAARGGDSQESAAATLMPVSERSATKASTSRI
jgi:hypothetical protein